MTLSSSYPRAEGQTVGRAEMPPWRADSGVWRSALRSDQRLLLDLLAGRAQPAAVSLPAWEAVVRLARMARVLATLKARMAANGTLRDVPEEAQRHMESEDVVARHRRQMVAWQMSAVGGALAAYDGPVVWLKGAAYIAARHPVADGRLPSDVDVMVPYSRLGEVEALLHAAGWGPAPLSAHDDRYYREWSHELPPMQCAELPLELDVHHTILPVTGRLRPDADALVDAAESLPRSRFRVLCAPDQVLHAATQLFQDSDCANRLRDLVDLDTLLRHSATRDDFWDRVAERARLHRLGRPLWYALRFCRALFDTPIPAHMLEAHGAGTPGWVARCLMDTLVPVALLPANPDVPPSRVVRAARAALYARAQWLRMPPRLLAYHASHKILSRLTGRARSLPDLRSTNS